ncbi:hypothetical protein Cpha266_1731 [Chlorobium phaeobacteroides DSM 266]|jgi:hypothetical protein|uniref:Uncharacterized protein n=2 Tax=Chlorobium phaeobacteroides TaxID=1096 RepID=A1BH71_CHLPD|nr:hypothetical protein Cpha266_1731 [Chlorobium phaeobacteroides DSM 266]
MESLFQHQEDTIMSEQQYQNEQKVVVTDIRMPFWSMVMFMVKWVFASIPALIILSIIMGIIMAIFTTLFGTLMGFHGFFQQGPTF